MNAARLIREAIRRRDEFTSDDIYRAVRKQIEHLRCPNGAVISELWRASQRGEIEKIGVRRAGKSVVNVWRRKREGEE